MESPAALFILDVGHGNSAVLVDTKGTVVIDAGPRTTLLEFLRQEEIPRIDVVLISHADKDHIAGLISLVESETVEIGRIRLNSDASKDSKLWKHLLFVLDKCHTAGKLDFDVALTRRNTGDFDQGEVSIEILAPSLRLAGSGGAAGSTGRRFKTNTLSAVVRLKYEDSPFIIFCGDIDEIGLNAMLQDESNPLATILVYPHHGGRSGAASEAEFAKQLCDAVQPKTVVFSIGRGHHSTPIPDVVEAVRGSLPGVRIACTQLSGHCAVDPPDKTPSHLPEHFAAGSRHNACCAGTIRIDFADGSFLPAADEHTGFIRVAAPEALCMKPRN